MTPAISTRGVGSRAGLGVQAPAGPELGVGFHVVAAVRIPVHLPAAPALAVWPWPEPADSVPVARGAITHHPRARPCPRPAAGVSRAFPLGPRRSPRWPPGRACGPAAPADPLSA